MRKSKLMTKLTILITLGILMLSFRPAVLGASKANRRPIEDWEVNNPFIIPSFDPDSHRLINFDFDWTDDYDGLILERVINDGFLMITVNLHVKNVGFSVFDFTPPGPPGELIISGQMDVNFKVKFTMAGEPNAELPWIIDIYIFERSFLAISLLCIGLGTFPASVEEYGFTPGTTGKVTVNQVGLMKKQLKEDHPHIIPDLDPPEMWPVEFIKIHELGKH